MTMRQRQRRQKKVGMGAFWAIMITLVTFWFLGGREFSRNPTMALAYIYDGPTHISLDYHRWGDFLWKYGFGEAFITLFIVSTLIAYSEMPDRKPKEE